MDAKKFARPPQNRQIPLSSERLQVFEQYTILPRGPGCVAQKAI